MDKTSGLVGTIDLASLSLIDTTVTPNVPIVGATFANVAGVSADPTIVTDTVDPVDATELDIALVGPGVTDVTITADTKWTDPAGAGAQSGTLTAVLEVTVSPAATSTPDNVQLEISVVTKSATIAPAAAA